jgi:hypothetical protein
MHFLLAAAAISFFNAPSISLPVFADDSGARPATMFESGATIHHAESVYIADNITATADRDGEFAVYRNFGLPLPASVAISGIEVTILANADNPTSRRTLNVSLSGDSGASYCTPVNTGDFGVAPSYRTLGGPDSNWGRNWMAGDLTDNRFRVKLQATTGIESIYIDFLQVKVYYAADTTIPTVMINQSTDQADPAGASPINFTAVFSEPVFDFSANNVFISGTAGATTATISGSGRIYNIAVSGMARAGTVIVNVNAGAAHDGASNYNVPSTSSDNTVTYNTSLPAFTITATAGANGSITPATSTVGYGTSPTYTIAASAGYYIADVLVDNISVGAVASYQFNSVTAPHTISAIFSATSTSGGSSYNGGVPGGRGGSSACPVSAQVSVNGQVTTVAMTRDGTTCQQCLAMSQDKSYQVRIEQGTRINSVENTIPKYIDLRVASKAVPEPVDGKRISPVIELAAYSDSSSQVALHATFEPNIELALPYDRGLLTEDASEVNIAYYDDSAGWTHIAGAGGPAEVGTARGRTNHLTPFAVVVKSTTPKSADITLSALSIVPASASPATDVTVSALAVNNGRVSGDFNAVLMLDGQQKGEQKFTLAPGEKKTVTFKLTADTAGLHLVSINKLGGQFETIAVKEKNDMSWLLWLVLGLIAAFCAWRFRRTWRRIFRRLVNRSNY